MDQEDEVKNSNEEAKPEIERENENSEAYGMPYRNECPNEILKERICRLNTWISSISCHHF